MRREKALKRFIIGLGILVLLALPLFYTFLLKEKSPVMTAGTLMVNADRAIGLETRYDNQDLVVSGATLTLDGEHSFSNITVTNNGTITHSAIPANGMVGYESDNFSVRWAGFMNVPYNLRSISLCTDSAMVLRIRPINGTWTQYTSSNSRYRCSDEGRFAAGMYEIRVDFWDDRGLARVDLQYEGYSVRQEGIIPASWYFLNQTKTQDTCGSQAGISGLCGQYWANYDPANRFGGTPTITRIDPQVNSNWGFNSPFPQKLGGLKLNINGELKLENGGKIDVGGKGYQGGGAGDGSVNAGYGPGGGKFLSRGLDCGDSSDDIGGGGGGYGGFGANGHQGDFPSSGGIIYGDDKMPQNAPNAADYRGVLVPAFFGSGGAGGLHEWCNIWGHHHRRYTGGSGGGSLIINANSVDIAVGGSINANGGSANTYSGAGSGGMIYIKANSWKNAWWGKPGVQGGQRLTTGSGTLWNVYAGNNSLIGYGENIDANGGAGNYGGECRNNPGGCGDGGGGRIVIDAPPNSGVPPTPTPQPTPSGAKTISGDIYGKNNVNFLAGYTVDAKAIIASEGGINAPSGVKLTPYNIDTVKLANEARQARSQLASEVAKDWTGNNFSGVWNLQSSTNDPTNLSKSSAPEGGAWQVPGNLTLGGTTFHGRGTIIVNGNLTINGNLGNDPTDQWAMVGFLVDGKVTINASAANVNAIIYSSRALVPGNYGIQMNGPIVFKGLLAAEGNIKLPADGGNTAIIYDGRLVQKSLPGFKFLQAVIRGEEAP